MKKISILFTFLIITLFSYSQSRADYNWSGNSGVSDNIDQGANWQGTNPPSGSNLYFSNTLSRHWAYSNYGAGSWFDFIITYSGAGGIKWYGNKTWAKKFENNSDPVLFEIESVIGNRSGFDIELNPVGSGGLKVTGNIELDASKSINVYGTNQLEITGIISGSTSNLNIINAATVLLSGINTYTGVTSIGAGTLQLGASGVIPDASAVTVTGTFDLAGYNETIGSIAGAGLVTCSTSGTPTITVGDDNTSTTYSGVIEDGSATSVGLTKNGSGTLILSGTNTNSGTTTVSAGTLQLEGNIANSNVTVSGSGALVINGDVTINNLTVVFGGTIEVLSGSNFTVAGSVHEVLGSTIIRSTGAMTINGSDAETWSLFTIENDAALTINGSAAEFGSSFIIESNVSGTGSLIIEGTTSGSITVERYIAAWGDAAHGWHFLSSPVTSQNISTEFVDVSGTISSDVDFYRWSESESATAGWINIKQGDGTYNQGSGSTNFSNDANPSFDIGNGYLVAYSTLQTKSFTGTVNVADVSSGSLSYTSGSDNRGFHLLGNPYPSALEWDQTTWSRVNIDATAKIWDETNAAYTDLAQGGIIPAMQGFMVQVSSDAAASLTIDASDRTHNTQDWYKNTEVNKLKLTAYDTEGNTAQESIIRVNENATTGFDSEFDSHFLAGYAPMFYSALSDGDIVSTNGLPALTSTTTIPMSFIKNGSSTYYIEVEGINTLEPQETLYLTDLKTNHTQILNDEPRYDFTSEEGDLAERFLIHFSPLSINNIQLQEQVNVYAANNNVEIRSNKPIDATINIYNIAGQLITTSQLNNESGISLSIQDYKGVVIVSITTSGQTINEKVIIW